MEGELDMGHARALLALEGAVQIAAANKIVLAGLSVREAEKLVQHELTPVITREIKKSVPDRDIVRLQEKVADRLGAKVLIQQGAKGAGKLVIEYKTLEQLDGVLAIMNVVANE
jgi:ParB family chromosome partitioning protein